MRVIKGMVALGVALCCAACTACLPSESEVVERLAASEAAVDEIVAAALGADVVTEWERERDEMALACQGDRSSVLSTLELAGSYPEEVLDRLAAAARAAGADTGPITPFHVEGEVVSVLFSLRWDRPDRYFTRVGWRPDTGVVGFSILTDCFRT
jgi:hypothetical protein